MRVESVVSMLDEELVPRAQESSDESGADFASAFETLMLEERAPAPRPQQAPESAPQPEGPATRPSLEAQLYARVEQALGAPVEGETRLPEIRLPETSLPDTTRRAEGQPQASRDAATRPTMMLGEADADVPESRTTAPSERQAIVDPHGPLDTATQSTARRPERPTSELEGEMAARSGDLPRVTRAVTAATRDAANDSVSVQTASLAGALAGRAEPPTTQGPTSRSGRANPTDAARRVQRESPNDTLRHQLRDVSDDVEDARQPPVADAARTSTAPPHTAAAVHASGLEATLAAPVQAGGESASTVFGAAPAPSLAAPTPATPGPLAPLPVQAIPQQVQIIATQGGGVAHMRLSPPELGNLQIRVSVRGSAVDVVIQADEPAAQLAVMTQREHLSDALGAREFRMDAFDVIESNKDATQRDLSGEQHASQRAFGDDTSSRRDPSPGQGGNPGAAAPERIEASRAASAPGAGSAGVDLRI